MTKIEDEEREDGDHRREVERPEARQEAPEEPQVRLADVVEEALDPVQPGRVRQPHPGHEDVREDQQDVDVTKTSRSSAPTTGVGEQKPMHAHAAQFRPGCAGSCPFLGLVEEAAALEEPGALLGRDLDVARRQQEDLVGDPLHAAVERVREAAREVDQPLRELLRRSPGG